MRFDQQALGASISTSRQAFTDVSLAALACERAMDRDEVRILKEKLLPKPV
jgi:hypothetical protein